MQGNENNSLLEKAMHVGERLVGVRGEASRLKTTASHAQKMQSPRPRGSPSEVVMPLKT